MERLGLSRNTNYPEGVVSIKLQLPIVNISLGSWDTTLVDQKIPLYETVTPGRLAATAPPPDCQG